LEPDVSLSLKRAPHDRPSLNRLPVSLLWVPRPLFLASFVFLFRSKEMAFINSGPAAVPLPALLFYFRLRTPRPLSSFPPPTRRQQTVKQFLSECRFFPSGSIFKTLFWLGKFTFFFDRRSPFLQKSFQGKLSFFLRAILTLPLFFLFVTPFSPLRFFSTGLRLGPTPSRVCPHSFIAFLFPFLEVHLEVFAPPMSRDGTLNPPPPPLPLSG